MTERPNTDQNSANAHEAAQRAEQWKVNPADLPTSFAMTTPNPDDDPYLQAQREAAEKEAREGTANAKPAITESTQEVLERERRQGSKIEQLTDQIRRRVQRALGGAGLRLA